VEGLGWLISLRIWTGGSISHWTTTLHRLLWKCIKKGKAIHITSRGGPQGCKMSRLPHILGNLLANCGEVVSLTHQLHFTPRMIPGTHFCWRLSRPQGHSAAERLGQSKNPVTSLGTETSYATACPYENVYWLRAGKPQFSFWQE
jgi:hypothetical protein